MDEDTAAATFKALYEGWPARADDHITFRESYKNKRPTHAPTPGERFRAREAAREFRRAYRARQPVHVEVSEILR